jgi:pyruvate/2-oxoglutarate dehydrogenase complex dihydrolipoamide acyltransferase (E2) component
LLWLGLNLPRTRPGQFGTFGLSVYSSLGAESLHPLSPLTTTLNYGVIEPDGTVCVRLIYDHRVLDGAMAARALGKLEDVLNGPILNELDEMTRVSQAAA